MKNQSKFFIFFAVFVLLFTISNIDSAFGSAVCPENTEWDGNDCTSTDIKEPKIKKSSKKNKDKPMQETIIALSPQEILNDLTMIKSEIKEHANISEIVFEQRQNQEKLHKVINRDSYYFNNIKKWSIKNAESTLYNILNQKDIQNPDFVKTIYKQIEYKERLNRNEDPVLQNQIILEKKIAEQKFLKLWGNFTNH